MSKPVTQKKLLRAEREFGLIVGGLLLLLSSWWMHRGKFHVATQFTLPLASLLLLLGIIFPRALIYPNKAWRALAEILSFISTRIVLGFVYFAIMTPIGVGKRLFGWDPLNRRAAASGTYWRSYSERQRDSRHYEKMF
ncbi:MAG: SxtJ family membrane protein [Pyrinomonadaceae bacterium]